VTIGTVEKGPGGRLCLAGAEGGGVSKLEIGDAKKGLFTVAGGEVLAFDYWVEGKAHKVSLSVWNRSRELTHEIAVPNLVRGKWARATLKLSDFVSTGGAPEAGDWIISVYVQGVSDGPLRFYVDNLQLSRPRKEK
jgi:hypothetical protein